jgi:hypothetical protein
MEELFIVRNISNISDSRIFFFFYNTWSGSTGIYLLRGRELLFNEEASGGFFGFQYVA